MYYDAIVDPPQYRGRVPQSDVIDLEFEEVYNKPKSSKKIKMEKKKFKRIFKGKSKSEMEVSFKDELRSKGVSIYLFEAFMNSRKRKILNDTAKKVLFIVLALFGFTLFCTLMAFAVDYDATFPTIFSKENISFIEKFVNILFGISLFGFSFITTGYSIDKLFKLF